MTPKLRCPYCGHRYSKVVNARDQETWAKTTGNPDRATSSRPDLEGFWRRRQCSGCGERFTTEETIRGRYKPKSTTTSSGKHPDTRAS